MSYLFFNIVKANSLILFILTTFLLLKCSNSIDDSSLKIEDGKIFVI